jgi:hypothetical protein
MKKDNDSNESILYTLMVKLDDRLDQMQTDLAVIKERQGQEIQQLNLRLNNMEKSFDQEIEQLQKDIQNVHIYAKQTNDKVSSRFWWMLSTVVVAMVGFSSWMIQKGVEKIFIK